MTMPEVSCKTVAVQNNSQWPCSMCPILQFRLGGGEDILYIYISWTPWVLDPSTNPYLGGPWLHPVTVTMLWKNSGETSLGCLAWFRANNNWGLSRVVGPAPRWQQPPPPAAPHCLIDKLGDHPSITDTQRLFINMRQTLFPASQL